MVMDPTAVEEADARALRRMRAAIRSGDAASVEAEAEGWEALRRSGGVLEARADPPVHAVALAVRCCFDAPLAETERLAVVARLYRAFPDARFRMSPHDALHTVGAFALVAVFDDARFRPAAVLDGLVARCLHALDAPLRFEAANAATRRDLVQAMRYALQRRCIRAVEVLFLKGVGLTPNALFAPLHAGGITTAWFMRLVGMLLRLAAPPARANNGAQRLLLATDADGGTLLHAYAAYLVDRVMEGTALDFWQDERVSMASTPHHVLRALLRGGIDPCAPDAHGRTALSLLDDARDASLPYLFLASASRAAVVAAASVAAADNNDDDGDDDDDDDAYGYYTTPDEEEEEEEEEDPFDGGVGSLPPPTASARRRSASRRRTEFMLSMDNARQMLRDAEAPVWEARAVAFAMGLHPLRWRDLMVP